MIDLNHLICRAVQKQQPILWNNIYSAQTPRSLASAVNKEIILFIFEWF